MNTDLVFDVGMNNGDDTAHYLYRGFRVVAIEADPTLVDAGRERFADAIRAGQLELVNAAIGPREEIAEFWICDEKREWNSFDRSFAARDGLPHHSIPIRCRRFGDLLKQYGVPYYLKIDIEGHDQYCLDDLNPADLPQYISLELGPFETMLRLQALGYSDFKLMTQNNHTQLVIDMFRARLKRRLQPYPALYGFSRKVAALMRGSGGGDDGNINGTDPINGWQFPFGSSGPFGEETPGEWRTLDDVMFTWTAYQLGYSKYGPPQLGIWHDVHARRQPA
jgi:FkbM family methyltransferase